MKSARDIMTPRPICIGSGDELLTTVRVFLDKGIHYCPVVTPSGEVLGLLSEYILVQASLRHYLDPDRHEKVIAHKDILVTPEFVEEGASLDDVVKALRTSRIHRLLVKNPRGELVGIISPRDILVLLHGESKGFQNLRVELEKKRKEAENLSAKISGMSQVLSKYQKLYDDSPYSMHSVDEKGIVVLANKRLHEMLGYKQGELIGVNVIKLYSDTVQHEAIQGLKGIMENGYQHNIYTTMVSKTGEKIRVDVASSALRDDHGNFLSTITISRVVDSQILLRALHGIVD